MSDPDEFDRELWLGLFAWVIVPAAMFFGFVIAVGISVDWMIHVGKEWLQDLRRDTK